MALTAALTLVARHATAAFAGFGSVGGADSAVPPPRGTGAAPRRARRRVERPRPAPAGPAVRGFLPIRYVETREPAVAITFDACATRSHHYGFDRDVFDMLKRERIPTTIFVSGRWVETHADVDDRAGRRSADRVRRSLVRPPAHVAAAGRAHRRGDRPDRGGAGPVRQAQRGVPAAVRRVEPAPGLRRSGSAAADGDLGRRLRRSERAHDHGRRHDPRTSSARRARVRSSSFTSTGAAGRRRRRCRRSCAGCASAGSASCRCRS